jgi:hypothetical protein
MISQWQKKLTKIRFGKIWWYNFEYEFSIHTLPEDIKQRFFQAVEQQLGAARNAIPLEILIDVLESPSQAFSLQGRQVGETELRHPFLRFCKCAH